jgi:hypothetical protein
MVLYSAASSAYDAFTLCCERELFRPAQKTNSASYILSSLCPGMPMDESVTDDLGIRGEDATKTNHSLR